MKSKNTASFLALFLGGIGIHRFYLGQTAKGVFSIIFFWTYIPLFISLIDFIIFITMSEKKFNIKYNPLIKNVNSNYKKEKAMPKKLVQNPVQNITVTVTTSVFSSNSNDDSVIDITDQSYTIPPTSNLKHNVDVPTWKHQYVYSYDEINRASSEQKKFYDIFRCRFLNGDYCDLEGNINYAFILLFDLLNEYDNSKDIPKLENQLKTLGQYYPKTKSYGIKFFREITEKIKKDVYFKYIIAGSYYQNNLIDIDYALLEWRNGYKIKLGINDDNTKLLDRIWYSSNSFANIEYCNLEIIKLYLAVISQLNDKLIQEETTIDEQFLSLADVIARKEFRYKNCSYNYKHCVKTAYYQFYSHIFTCCYNTVCQFYGQEIQVDTNIPYDSTEVKNEFQNKFSSKISQILSTLASEITSIDKPTDIEYYSTNANSWKIRFEELTTNYNDNPKEFVKSIYLLAKLNEEYPNVKNIFFESSKFIAKFDKELAIHLYTYHMFYSLKLGNLGKNLPKTILKTLFETEEQLQNFETVKTTLFSGGCINDVNIIDFEKALKQIPEIYKIKRKKIQLNTASIKEVQKQHSGTVELLNEYLKDDFDDENNAIKSQEISNEEIQIIQKKEEAHQSSFVSELCFTTIHTATLELFAKSNFSISQEDFEVFTKSKGVFKNSLIESINDTCYEFLDDVLIEEEEDYYTINANYFHRISAK